MESIAKKIFARDRLILWVLAAALVVRVLALLNYGLKFNPGEDATGYFNAAAVLARTGRLTFYGIWPSAMSMPAFVALLSVPFRLTQDTLIQYVLVKSILVALSLVSVYLVYLLGTRVGGTPVGLLAAAILAGSPASLYVANATYVENAVQPIVLLLILLGIRLGDKPSAGRAGLFIAALCLGLYVREVVVVVAIASVAYLLLRRCPVATVARFVALGLLAAVLVMSPWWVRNYREFGYFIPFTSNGASPLYEGTFQTFHPYRTGSMEALGRLLRNFHGSLKEQNVLLTNAAVARVVERWHEDPAGLIFTYAVGKPAAAWALPFYWADVLGMSSYWVVRLHALLSAIGIALLAFFSFRSDARDEFRFFLLIIMAMTVASAVYLGLSRYVYPFMPLLYVAVAYGAVRVAVDREISSRLRRTGLIPTVGSLVCSQRGSKAAGRRTASERDRTRF